MATSPDFAPYEFYALDENKEPQLAGFDMDLAQYIACLLYTSARQAKYVPNERGLGLSRFFAAEKSAAFFARSVRKFCTSCMKRKLPETLVQGRKPTVSPEKE